jgi:hypothetical protein
MHPFTGLVIQLFSLVFFYSVLLFSDVVSPLPLPLLLVVLVPCVFGVLCLVPLSRAPPAPLLPTHSPPLRGWCWLLGFKPLGDKLHDEPFICATRLGNWCRAHGVHKIRVCSAGWRAGVHYWHVLQPGEVAFSKVVRLKTHRSVFWPRGLYGAKESFFDDSPQKSAVLSPNVESYLRNLRVQRAHTPWSVPERLLPLLDRLGLPRPPPFAPTHEGQHPVAASLELASLRFLNTLLNGLSWYGLFINPDKITGFTVPTGLYNPKLVAKDVTRFRACLDNVDAPPRNPAPTWFAHDVLHFLTPSEVGSWFDSNRTLSTLFGTIVAPVEMKYRLGSTCPDLYTLRYHGDKVKITFEGDSGGAYWQPADSWRWVQSETLITPAGECLHVGLIYTKGPHAIVVVRRGQLYPGMLVAPVSPDLMVVPKWVLPFSPLSARVTLPSLVEKLEDFSSSLDTVEWRHLATKLRQFQMSDATLYPASYKTAACCYVLALRLFRGTWQLGPLTTASLLSSVFLSMPLLSPAWFFSSFLYSFSADLVPLAEPFDPTPRSLVSRHSDWRMQVSDVCDFPAVGVHYVPPQALPFERFWVKLVSLQALLVVKFALGQVVPRLPQLWSFAHRAAPVVVFRLGIRWDTPILAAVALVLTYWWDISVEDAVVTLRQFGRFLDLSAVRYAKLCWKIYWGLPSLPLPRMRVGYSPLWRALSMWMWITFLFPHLLHPLPSIFMLRQWYHWCWFLPLVGYASCPKAFQRRLYPFHSVRVSRYVGDVENSSDSASTSSYESCTTLSSILNWRAESPFDAISELSTPPPSPLPIPPARLPLPTFVPPAAPRVPLPVAPAAPIVLPVPPPLPAIVPPPPVGGIAVGGYHILPSAFPSAALFTFTARLLPLPPAIPPANNMCVWDCLSFLLDVDPAILWALFNESYPGVAPNGAVPYARLSTVFAFFCVSGTITRAERPGPVPIARDSWTPEQYGTVVEGWPVFNWSLVELPGQTFHLVAVAPVIDYAAQVQPGPFPVSWVASSSRFVSISEMRHALNIPVKVYQRIYHAFTGITANPAAPSAFANSDTPGQPPPPAPGLPPLAVIPDIDLRPEDVNYRLTARDLRDARMLASDYKKYPKHLEVVDTAAPSLATAIDAIAEHAQPSDCNMRLYHGAYGTGKTTAFITEIQTLIANGVGPQDITIVCPNDGLRAELMDSIRPAVPSLVSNNFVTQGKIFVNMGARYVFFDDAGLYYPGFIQLVLCCLPNIARSYYSFDCAQNRRIFPENRPMSGANTPTGPWLAAKSNTYATKVYRSSRSNTALLGLNPAACTTEGEVYIVTQPPRDIPLLVASPRFAMTKANYGPNAISFQDVQGQTFDGDIAIDMGGYTASTTDNGFLTAFTRARGSVWLVYSPQMPSTSTLQEQSYGQTMIASAMLAVAAVKQTSVVNLRVDTDRIVARAFQTHLASSLSLNACQLLGLNPAQPVVAGIESYSRHVASAVQAVARAPDEPQLTPRSFMPIRSAAPFSNLVQPKSLLTRPQFARHAVRNYLPLTVDSTLKIDAPKYIPPPLRARVALVDPLDCFDVAPVPCHEEAVVPNFIEPTNTRDPLGPREAQHHRGNDQALFWKSQPERFPARRDDPTLSPSDRNRFAQLRAGFSKSVDLSVPVEFNDMLFEDCLVHCADSWFAGKSKAQILKAIADWEVDDDPCYIRIFQKGQWIKKLEARGLPVKKSQIIARVAMSRTFADAVWCEYLERSIRTRMKPNVLFFNRMNPTELKSWYRGHWKPGLGVTSNDYTGWDTGMDRVFLAFDVWLMEQCRFPAFYIERYVHQRCHSRTFVGPYPIMQPSGDRWTLFLNSMRNIGVIQATFNSDPDTPIAVCGDDAVLCGIWEKNWWFRPHLWRIQPKTFRGPTAAFCGWSFGGRKLYVDLRSLTYRARIGLQRGEASLDFWRSSVDMLRLTAGESWDYSELASIYRSVSAHLCPSFVSPFDSWPPRA